MTLTRLITTEEHVTFEDIAAQAQALAAPVDRTIKEPEFTSFLGSYFGGLTGYQDLGAERLAHMDRVGVDVQVVSHGHGSPSNLIHPRAVELCRSVNDRLAGMIGEHPDRFVGLATVPLIDPDAAADELQRCVEELGFRGLLVAGGLEDQFLDHPRFLPLLERAARLGAPLYIHPLMVRPQVRSTYYAGDWSQTAEFMFATSGYGWHIEAGIHVLRLIVAGVCDALPELKILSGHWGEMVPGYLERLDDQLGLAFPGRERSISQTYRDQVWVTPSGIYTNAQLQLCLEQMGADHIVWSQDYPYITDVEPRAFLLDAPVSDEVRAKLAHGNAEALFGI
ncbi:amidohydrolase family protein [Corynebacterium uberis]|uniref:amidohydrolase family protein n=1 Tax=Corynebacterium TaxID=1716 RepID=UPI001D0BC355|nr:MULTISPECIES: amidohydrolase family protein [Corynebacterium]MCZ9309589.1 amidohydrolase family protein [Corynebacterium sp. c6VSa_13]UDL75722.1 amidohydrolase family protein [Corynebacterium uberis]UDL77934.1 amidohydrolase family protein [Corynebacterium uberis]UDL80218.1 amidohydrolase family protein [Corynebacterium uberis]UDL82352.1 amidohydrolase family protein [Corynebacterium uberis]